MAVRTVAFAALCCWAAVSFSTVSAAKSSEALSGARSGGSSHDGIKGNKNTGCTKGCLYADVCYEAGAVWADPSVKSCKQFVCNAKKGKNGKETYDVGTKRCPSLGKYDRSSKRKVSGNLNAAYPACCPYLTIA